ncbi:MAG TPA: response regulator [Ferruginibacter sp.]|nr:response regulator [Ferruginibacter sp.]
MKSKPRPRILMIEHDPDDRALTKDVFADQQYQVDIDFVDSGNGVMPYMDAAAGSQLLPNLILLNVQLPPRDGMDILREIKTHEQFYSIPVVMLSESNVPGIVNECYRSGANSFIKKPSASKETYDTIHAFIQYWFSVNSLPGDEMIG